MTADPKPDAVTADHLREMARLCRPCACDYGCRHDVARGKIHDLGGWHTIAMKLLDEADELRTELAEARGSAQSAHAVCFAAGIEAAAKYHDNFLMTKTSVAVEKVVASTEAIRALTPPDITAAAARVLLAAWPTDTSFDAAFAACATAYHGGYQMQDTMDLTLSNFSD